MVCATVLRHASAFAALDAGEPVDDVLAAAAGEPTAQFDSGGSG